MSMPGSQDSLETAYGGSPIDKMTDGELVDICEHEGTPLMYCDAIRVRMADLHLRVGKLAKDNQRLREACETGVLIGHTYECLRLRELENDSKCRCIVAVLESALRGGGE